MIFDQPTVDADLGAGRFTRGLPPRAGVLMPPFHATRVLARHPHRARLLFLRWSFALALADDAGLPADGNFGVLHTRPLARFAWSGLVNAIRAEALAGNPRGVLFLDGAVLLLLSELMAEMQAPLRGPSGGLAGWQVRRVTEYLNDHLAEPVSLQELAGLVRLSPYHFARTFKLSTGLPPHRYHTIRRVEKAKELLEHTELTITEIAHAVGYATPQALARVFRSSVGCAPSEWRQARLS